MDKNKAKAKEFGTAVRFYRIAANESLENLAEAMEVSEKELDLIEAGKKFPSEEVTEMLINHFALQETEAAWLRKLAGNSDEAELLFVASELSNESKPIEMRLSGETRIFYTDMVYVVSDKAGVVISFLQNAGAGNDPVVVSRVGMSREQAKSIIAILKDSLEEK